LGLDGKKILLDFKDFFGFIHLLFADFRIKLAKF